MSSRYANLCCHVSEHEFEKTPGDRRGQECWRVTIHGVPKSRTQLNNCITTIVLISARISFIYSLTVVLYSTAKDHKNFHLNSSQTERHYSFGFDTKIYNIKSFFSLYTYRKSYKESFLSLLFLKNNQPKLILMPKRHILGG